MVLEGGAVSYERGTLVCLSSAPSELGLVALLPVLLDQRPAVLHLPRRKERIFVELTTWDRQLKASTEGSK